MQSHLFNKDHNDKKPKLSLLTGDLIKQVKIENADKGKSLKAEDHF